MPRKTMPLTPLEIKGAKPKEKPYRLFDGGGLYVEVTPAGGKLWRMKYLIDGKERRLSFGAFPAVGLADARQRRDEAKKLLASGVDPGEVRKAQKATRHVELANTFKAVSLEWLEKQKPKWSEKHHQRIVARLDNNVWPWIGEKPVSDIEPVTVLDVLRKIEERNAHYMAGRVKESISRVMNYATATGRAKGDPTVALSDVLTAHVEKHMASVTDPKRVGEILRAFDAFTGTHTVRSALLLAPLVFARPGELRKMRWADLDLDGGLWELDRGSMKMREPHIVPLSTQAVEIIKGMQPVSEHLEYVFRGGRDPKRPMSDAAINAALRRLGIDTQEELTGHGFRAMARTILRERLGFDSEWIEAQLSHKKQGALGSAYDRTIFLEQRKGMMQAWADYLDKLKAGAEVIPLRNEAA